MHGLMIRWSVGPFPPRGFPPRPRYYGPIRLPSGIHRPSGCPWGRCPRNRSVVPRGSPGFRALPVPACRRLWPRWTRSCSRLGERPRLPSPPLHTGRRPRWRGFRGWSRSLPPLADFGPQDSCLRFAPAVTDRDARLGPSDPMACRVAGGTSYATPGRRSPTGKRRLSPAHATSPSNGNSTSPVPSPVPHRCRPSIGRTSSSS